MSPQRSNSRPKASKKNTQKSPTPKEEFVQRWLRGQSQRLRKAKTGDGIGCTGRGKKCDIFDLINNAQDEECVGGEDGGKAVEITDQGLDDSEEYCVSVCNSTESGPSLYLANTRKPRPSQNLCSACRKLYQKAKKIKTPVINKVLDNDPKSLTCDQWVLTKKWTPQRLPNARGKLLSHVTKLKNACAKQSELCVGGSSTCSRPHTFLHRNLRRCIKVKKERKRKRNRRKRPRDDSQGSRVAKQQRLHGNTPIRINCVDVEPNSHQEGSSQGNTDVTVEAMTSSVTWKTTKPNSASSQRASKKMGGFRKLLAELRSKSSIIRETR
ncbi:uncharacterized protein LOC115795992 isoform X2 [Archocentrus centrarchus]|nr:uncharacterized protein LOC115795992 isoform X2 [Archocentrus centrarchus]XP_030608025.1 uncharacterized protein LOC115795992 isoform X2 [Archocentrus centrarchus]